jgi:hypothetical protein
VGEQRRSGDDLRPARHYSWPPFEAGNEAATKHGVWSARRTDPLAAELVAGLVADRPDLSEYPEAVLAWARAEARCLLLADWLLDHGLMDGDGTPRGALRYVAQFERLASDLRDRLGLDPRSDAALRRERADAVRSAVDLEGIRARGRAALEARVTATGPTAPQEHSSGRVDVAGADRLGGDDVGGAVATDE